MAFVHIVVAGGHITGIVTYAVREHFLGALVCAVPTIPPIIPTRLMVAVCITGTVAKERSFACGSCGTL